MTYTVQDTTMTALGDAMRSKVTLEEVSSDSKSNLFHLEIKNTADLNVADLKIENDQYVYMIPIPQFSETYAFWIGYHNRERFNQKVSLRCYDDNGNIVAEETELFIIYNQRIEDRYANRKTTSFFQNNSTKGTIYLVIPLLSLNWEVDLVIDAFVYRSSENIYYHTPKFTPTEMVEAINNLIALSEDDLVFTNANYLFAYGAWTNVLNKCSNKIVLKNCYSLNQTFLNDNRIVDLSGLTIDGGYNDLTSTFSGCTKLQYLPTVKSYRCWGLNSTFNNCQSLRTLGNFFDNITLEEQRDTTKSATNTFYFCNSLRKIPDKVLEGLRNNYNYYFGAVPYSCFNQCYSLDEIVGWKVFQHLSYAPSDNYFRDTFNKCHRLKEVIFSQVEGETINWTNQVIDLSQYVGYALYLTNIINYNSGITSDKEVKDDATYQALKNDPDWFTCDINYSRYNHDSAVNTINSLPDTSAFGTNIIKFKGASGAKTDGGAINTLTEAEIAVASAKGWTVSLV